jgi:hypothetical protein
MCRLRSKGTTQMRWARLPRSKSSTKSSARMPSSPPSWTLHRSLPSLWAGPTRAMHFSSEDKFTIAWALLHRSAISQVACKRTRGRMTKKLLNRTPRTTTLSSTRTTFWRWKIWETSRTSEKLSLATLRRTTDRATDQLCNKRKIRLPSSSRVAPTVLANLTATRIETHSKHLEKPGSN